MRDYAKENAKRDELNRAYFILLEKKVAKEFDEKLEKENKSIAGWFRENVEKYLNK